MQDFDNALLFLIIRSNSVNSFLHECLKEGQHPLSAPSRNTHIGVSRSKNGNRELENRMSEVRFTIINKQ